MYLVVDSYIGVVIGHFFQAELVKITKPVNVYVHCFTLSLRHVSGPQEKGPPKKKVEVGYFTS